MVFAGVMTGKVCARDICDTLWVNANKSSRIYVCHRVDEQRRSKNGVDDRNFELRKQPWRFLLFLSSFHLCSPMAMALSTRFQTGFKSAVSRSNFRPRTLARCQNTSDVAVTLKNLFATARGNAATYSTDRRNTRGRCSHSRPSSSGRLGLDANIRDLGLSRRRKFFTQSQKFHSK